jgi:hypothetical protein
MSCHRRRLLLPPRYCLLTTEVLPPTTLVADEAAEEETVTTATEVGLVMTDEAVALLDSYEAAFNAGDEATFRSFFSPDFWRADPGFLDYKQPAGYMVNMMRNSRVQQTTLSIEDCTRTDEGAQCKFIYAGAVEQALYFGPIIDTVEVHIVDGTIPVIFRNEAVRRSSTGSRRTSLKIDRRWRSSRSVSSTVNSDWTWWRFWVSGPSTSLCGRAPVVRSPAPHQERDRGRGSGLADAYARPGNRHL